MYDHARFFFCPRSRSLDFGKSRILSVKNERKYSDIVVALEFVKKLGKYVFVFLRLVFERWAFLKSLNKYNLEILWLLGRVFRRRFFDNMCRILSVFVQNRFSTNWSLTFGHILEMFFWRKSIVAWFLLDFDLPIWQKSSKLVFKVLISLVLKPVFKFEIKSSNLTMSNLTMSGCCPPRMRWSSRSGLNNVF